MIQRISTYIVISALFVGLSYALESSFLLDFLYNNIVVIIITLLAINTATYGFILSKLDDITKNGNESVFDKGRTEIKKSLKFQLGLIISAIIVSIMSSSEIVRSNMKYTDEIFTFAFTFIFVFALDLLRDTGFAIFELRDPKNK